MTDTTTNPLKIYTNYPFASDDTYQQGLASLIGGGLDDNLPAIVREEMLRKTRVFYFNKVTGHSISMDDARDYELSHSKTNRPMEPPTQDTRILTFAELQALIESGREDQIPNNKVIPDALNDAPPSQSTAPLRKKPWELAGVQE